MKPKMHTSRDSSSSACSHGTESDEQSHEQRLQRIHRGSTVCLVVDPLRPPVG
jgi:hypothetical protein